MEGMAIFISQLGKLAHLLEAMELMVYLGFEPGLLVPKDWCINLSRPSTNVC